MNTVVEEAKIASENLKERLLKHDNNRARLQEELVTKVGKLRRELDELEERINENLHNVFSTEEERLQNLLSNINNLLVDNEYSNATETELLEAVTEGRTALLVEQTYSLEEVFNVSKLGDSMKLNVNESLSSESVRLEERQPTNLKVSGASPGFITVDFHFLSEEEQHLLKERNVENTISYRVSMQETSNDNVNEIKETDFLLKYNERTFFGNELKEGVTYKIKIRGEFNNGNTSKWSDTTLFTTNFSQCCTWKKCPRYVTSGSEYILDTTNTRIAIKKDTGEDDDDYVYGYSFTTYATIIGNIPIPLNGVTSWNIKILKTWNHGQGVYIGVASSNVNQDFSDNFEKDGWYFNCHNSKLWSGPPHNYRAVEYGPRKRDGLYVQTGDVVGVVVDTTKGSLSFVLNEVNLGIAYSGIPLDKPIVPCVILEYEGDSVEIIP